MIRFYFMGLFILIFAIGANGIAQSLGIKTWYGFIQLLLSKNESIMELAFLDILWLFFIYPLILGTSAAIGAWIYNQIIAL